MLEMTEKDKPLGRFHDLGLARSFSARCQKSTEIVLGDDDRFWVVTLAVMSRMVDAGYDVLREGYERPDVSDAIWSADA